MYRSFWNTLPCLDKPIFIYGTGNGADKIIDILDHVGERITGVFASDGFVRNRTFRGFPVRSYSDVRSEYGDDIAVIAAFGSTLPDVLDFLDELDRRHELYVPEVPLFCDDLLTELFDDRYYEAHMCEIETVEGFLADEESVLLYRDMISHRLTGKLCYLKRTEEPAESLRTLFEREPVNYAIDGGAFKGDTAELFCEVFPNLLSLAAVEPDPRSYRKLDAMAEGYGGRIVPINAMLGDADGERVFVSSGSRGSAPDAAIPGSPKRAKEVRTAVLTIDTIVESKLGGKIDFVKLDTEGFEMDALVGASETLRKRPALSVSLYHRTADMFKLPLYLREFYPDGKFYLRRPKCVPEWDLTLYVTN